MWITPAVSAVLTLVTLIIYTVINDSKNPMVYIQTALATCVTAILPLITTVTKKEFSPVLNVMVAAHVFLACCLGSAMGFYSIFAYWDLFLHGFFGLIAAVVLYELIRMWNGDKLNRTGYGLLIFLGVMGSAALWEVFEFICDGLFGGDAQRVMAAQRAGTNPVEDTMTDIMVTAVGAIVFFIFCAVRNKLNKKGSSEFSVLS